MASVGVFEAKDRLTALLDEVEASRDVLITRLAIDRASGPGRARLRSPPPSAQGRTLGDVSLRQLIDEGRR